VDQRLARLSAGLERPIGDHGAIGEGRSVALLASDGTLDWWCPGRFDAPSAFAAILDAEAGGHFRLGPTVEASSLMRYVSDTNVLETVHTTERGRVRVCDFMPFPEDAGVEDAVLVRRVEGLEGAVEMGFSFRPRFAYGAVTPRLARTPAGLLARGAGEIMLLQAPEACLAGEARLVVGEGERFDVVLRHRPFVAAAPFDEPLAMGPAALEARAVARWRAWSAKTRYEGPEAPMVRRSALALKLLQYAPTGAIVAAPTTSLPEALGGARNWDYRFAWLRDAALCARALHDVGHPEEGRAFASWVERTLGREPGDLRIMYSVSGQTDLAERELAHLRGHRGSAPVRVGNGAAEQRQLDVYGELVDALAGMGAVGPRAWPIVRGLAERVAQTWREPDSGIWEMRAQPRHFVLSKAMAWAALTRAAALAREKGYAGDADAWLSEAEAIRADVDERGVHPEVGFVQAYGFVAPDASNLLLPLVGFVDARDPRMLRTTDCVIETLATDGLVYRYRNDDGLPGGEATFAYCAFWLVEVLALQGRVAEARRLLESLLVRASPLGLYAEEIDEKSGEHLGNFPQGFPHAGLISAALALKRAEAGELKPARPLGA